MKNKKRTLKGTRTWKETLTAGQIGKKKKKPPKSEECKMCEKILSQKVREQGTLMASVRTPGATEPWISTQ